MRDKTVILKNVGDSETIAIDVDQIRYMTVKGKTLKINFIGCSLEQSVSFNLLNKKSADQVVQEIVDIASQQDILYARQN